MQPEQNYIYFFKIIWVTFSVTQRQKVLFTRHNLASLVLTSLLMGSHKYFEAFYTYSKKIKTFFIEHGIKLFTIY